MGNYNTSSLILAKSWWSILIRGLAAFSLGAATMAWRGIALGDLILLFFGWALFDGLVSVAGAVRTAEERQRGQTLLLLEGLSGIVVAVAAVGWPNLSDSAHISLIAAWGLVIGVIEIAAGIQLRKYVSGELLLTLSGVASLMLGALMAALAFTGATAIALWIDIYALVFGFLLTGLGFRLRSWIKLPAVSRS